MQDIELVSYLNSEAIREAVDRIAQEITEDYEESNEAPLLICVLKGASPFFHDLVQRISLPITLDYVRVSSYHSMDREDLRMHLWVEDAVVAGRDVILVEDIVDTGVTVQSLVGLLRAQGASSVKVCALLDKAKARLVKGLKLDYVGFTIPKKFVVGYGLDFNERYRNLNEIFYVKQS